VGTSLCALRASALLAGSSLLTLAVLGAILSAGIAACTWAPAAVTVAVAVLSVLLGVPVVRGTVLLGRPGHGDVTGLPERWWTVRSLAGHVGARAPGAFLLTGNANAGVCEETRLPARYPARASSTAVLGGADASAAAGRPPRR
jgi:hypothetical protein